MTRKAFLARGAAFLLLAGGLAASALGCSGGADNQAAEAPGDTQAVRANMVYYAMPG
jgi:hypothetical protein